MEERLKRQLDFALEIDKEKSLKKRNFRQPRNKGHSK